MNDQFEYEISTTVPDESPRPFSELPELWLQVFNMSEQFFAQEAKRASGSNTLISVIIYSIFVVITSTLTSALTSPSQSQISSLASEFGGVPGTGMILLYTSCCALIMAPIGFYIGNGILLLGARVFGGQGSFASQAYTQTLFIVPISVITFITAFGNIVPIGAIVTGIINLGIAIYSFVLNVRAIKAVHNLTTGRAIGAIFAPGLVLMGIACLVIGGLALMGPAVGDVFSEILTELDAPMP